MEPIQTATMTNQMQNAIQAIDHAATMSDRWLFIAALVAIGFMGYIIGRVFLKQNAALLIDLKTEREKSRESSDKYNETLISVIGELKAMGQKSNDVIANNTTVMQSVVNEMSQCRRKI